MTSLISATASLITRTLTSQKQFAQYQGRAYSTQFKPFYKGELKNDQPHGHGTKHYSRDECYTGEWVNGKRHGIGSHVSPRGKDEGEWHEDKRTGWGTTIYEDGTKLKGYWKNNTWLKD